MSKSWIRPEPPMSTIEAMFFEDKTKYKTQHVRRNNNSHIAFHGYQSPPVSWAGELDLTTFLGHSPRLQFGLSVLP